MLRVPFPLSPIGQWVKRSVQTWVKIYLVHRAASRQSTLSKLWPGFIGLLFSVSSGSCRCLSSFKWWFSRTLTLVFVILSQRILAAMGGGGEDFQGFCNLESSGEEGVPASQLFCMDTTCLEGEDFIPPLNLMEVTTNDTYHSFTHLPHSNKLDNECWTEVSGLFSRLFRIAGLMQTKTIVGYNRL